ncbi:mechanosensitive ion channel family protein [uncultured Eubacterium sp.]|uniref:mechanosensitive ion channel family protein n=1 Tax=uncultured Eubacterium sp. TaxID=165185 RepID=UPI002673E916|nr:mechanosensitive ion channel family protein [uncultured Eubacterium sp.]
MNFLFANSVEEIQSNVDKLNEDVSKLTKFLDTALEKLIDFGFSIIVAIIIFLIGKIIIKLVRKFIKNIFTKSKVDEGVIKFIDSIVNVAGYIIVLIIICAEIGIQTTSFVTLLGTAGLSVGLALQGSLSNFAGGILILVSKPFKIGDYVMIDGEEGTVIKIDIVYTTLVKYDNRIIKCPNGEVSNKTIVNYTNMDGRRVDVKFSIHYDSDISKAKEIVTNIILNCPYTLKEKKNNVVVTKLDESSVNLETRAWVRPDDYWDAFFYLNEAIKSELEKNNIVIPYNQLEVHVKS